MTTIVVEMSSSTFEVPDVEVFDRLCQRWGFDAQLSDPGNGLLLADIAACGAEALFTDTVGERDGGDFFDELAGTLAGNDSVTLTFTHRERGALVRSREVTVSRDGIVADNDWTEHE